MMKRIVGRWLVCPLPFYFVWKHTLPFLLNWRTDGAANAIQARLKMALAAPDFHESYAVRIDGHLDMALAVAVCPE